MAIKLEFSNMIIPISVIEKEYTGGWEQYLRDNELKAEDCEYCYYTRLICGIA